MSSVPKILIVNSDRKQADIYMQMLEEEGCRVDIAKSDMDAMTLLGCRHYDVAVIEVIDPLKTISFYLNIKTPREKLTDFCVRIGCEFVIMTNGSVKPVNGHPVMQKTDRRGLLDHILLVASQSLAC